MAVLEKTKENQEFLADALGVSLKSLEKKPDFFWANIFYDFNLVEQVEHKGKVVIDADLLRKYREPRLMTKFDTSKSLPSIFQKCKLSILPQSRSQFIVAPFNAYCNLGVEQDQGINSAQVVHIPLPEEVQSLSATSVTSEALALNSAYAAGFFHHFLGQERLYPAISGKRTAGEFSFQVPSHGGGKLDISVNGTQMEIDASFEGPGTLALVEAKNKLYDDFLVRQLYYPYRAVGSLMGGRKRVRNLYFTHVGSIYDIYEYEFQEDLNYGSCQLIKHLRYSLEPLKLSASLLLREAKGLALESRKQEKEERVFPQADSLERIVNLCEKLSEGLGGLSSAEVAEFFSFDRRQGDYYISAAAYLGLVQKRDGLAYLSSLGKNIFSSGIGLQKKRHQIARQVLSNYVFYRIFYFLSEGIDVNKTDIVNLMVKEVKGLSEETIRRRAGTVHSWCKQILIWCQGSSKAV